MPLKSQMCMLKLDSWPYLYQLTQSTRKFSAMSTLGDIKQAQGFLHLSSLRLANLEMVFAQCCAQSLLSEKMPGNMTKRGSQMVCTVPLRKIKTLKATVVTKVCWQNLNCSRTVTIGTQFLPGQSCSFSFSPSCPLLPAIMAFVCMMSSN